MRTPVAHLVLALAVAAARSVPAHAQDDNAGEDRLRVFVSPLSYGIMRNDAPVTVIVSITNPDSRFSGTIEAWIGEHQTASAVEHCIDIGKGKFRFFLYPQSTDASEQELFVRVRSASGDVDTKRSVMVRRKEALWWIGVVPGRERRFSQQDLPDINAVVIPMHRTDMLPDQWYGYKMFDALLWDGQAEASMRTVQRKALADWIQGGGRLIMMARRGDASIASPLPEIVPSLTLGPATEQGADSGGILFSAAEMPAPHWAVFVEKKYGMGSIVLLRADSASLSTWSRERGLALLGYTFGEPVRTRHEGEMYQDEQVLKAILARSAGYTELSFKPVLVTVLIYLMMVSFVDYLVLKRMKKLPWTWATFPALIGVFSIFSFFAFYRGELSARERHELLFQDVGYEARGRILTMSCMRKSSTKPIELEVDTSHFLSELGDSATYDDMYGYGYRRGRYAGPRTTRILESTMSTSAKRIMIPGYVGSFQFFTEEWVPDSTNVPFSCGFGGSQAGLQGQITSHIDGLTSAFVLYRGRIYDVDMNMRISGNSKGITEIGDPWHDLRPLEPGPMQAADLVGTLAGWTKLHTKNFIMRSNAHYGRSGQYTHDPGRDSILRHFLRRDAAIVFAFCEEKDKDSDIRVRRVRCIRQVVDVIREGNTT